MTVGATSLNEVQFPKELRPAGRGVVAGLLGASMKCSSRRNCDRRPASSARRSRSLNEVQFPKELRQSLQPSSSQVMEPQ